HSDNVGSDGIPADCCMPSLAFSRVAIFRRASHPHRHAVFDRLAAQALRPICMRRTPPTKCGEESADFLTFLFGRSYAGLGPAGQRPLVEVRMLDIPRTSQISHLLKDMHEGDAAALQRLIAYLSDRLRMLAYKMLYRDRLRR